MSPEKQEFQRLAALAKTAGWNAAELSRRLKVSAAHVSGLINGDSEPSETIIELLKCLLQQHRPELFSYPASPEERIIGPSSREVHSAALKLEELHDADPEAFKTVERVIGDYHGSRAKKKTAKPKPNLTAAQKRAAASATGALKAAGILPASSPSRGADEPSEHTHPPDHGTAKRSTQPHEPPKRTPK